MRINLLLDEGNLVLVELLIQDLTQLADQNSLYQFFNKPEVKSKILALKHKNVLKANQVHILSPKSKIVDLSNIDISFAFVIFRHICNISIPSNGWNKLPDLQDVSKSANILRLKMLKDNRAHNSLDMDSTNFQSTWEFIKKTLVALGARFERIDAIMNENIDVNIYRKLTQVQKCTNVIAFLLCLCLFLYNLHTSWTVQDIDKVVIYNELPYIEQNLEGLKQFYIKNVSKIVEKSEKLLNHTKQTWEPQRIDNKQKILRTKSKRLEEKVLRTRQSIERNAKKYEKCVDPYLQYEKRMNEEMLEVNVSRSFRKIIDSQLFNILTQKHQIGDIIHHFSLMASEMVYLMLLTQLKTLAGIHNTEEVFRQNDPEFIHGDWSDKFVKCDCKFV